MVTRVVEVYQRSVFQAAVAGVLAERGIDIYAESGAVVCDKCGLLQAYRSDEGGDESEIHSLIYRCQGLEEVGCGSETCITYSRYREEMA
jgi:hypothetical protein